MTPPLQMHSSSRRGAPHRWTHETPDAFVLKADLPGLTTDAIQVEVHGRTLTQRGERKPRQGRMISTIRTCRREAATEPLITSYRPAFESDISRMGHRR
jgi:HSP20 family molecular chaperone IbpA